MTLPWLWPDSTTVLAPRTLTSWEARTATPSTARPPYGGGQRGWARRGQNDTRSHTIPVVVRMAGFLQVATPNATRPAAIAVTTATPPLPNGPATRCWRLGGGSF